MTVSQVCADLIEQAHRDRIPLPPACAVEMALEVTEREADMWRMATDCMGWWMDQHDA